MTTRLEIEFSRFALQRPHKLAVDSVDEHLTYGDLDALANRFAQAFASVGVGVGDRVGIHMPRSGRAIAAMIGALRVGAAYVPLDPASPPSRVQLIARDCGIRVIVIAPVLLYRWAAFEVEEPIAHFFLSEDGPIPSLPDGVQAHAWSELPSESLVPFVAPPGRLDDLAYVLYTSGSTGVPKGVMLSHRNALAFAEWAGDVIELSEHDRVASVAPFHFDLSVFDIWSTLSCGSTLVIVSEAAVVQGHRMLDLIHSRAITVWYSVPSSWALMLETGGLAERGAPSLRVVYFAGEVFPLKQLRRTMQALPRARFFNLFGPTETNVCLAHELPGVPAEDVAAIPIGRASCGAIVTVVDEQGRPLPDGEVGELLVEGPTVMLGYWDGGRRTPAHKPYRTGDLVSRLPSGELMYHGRRDHMVKVHGYRVELGEVEAALYVHSAIQDAIVFAHEQRLVAVVVSSDPSLSVIGIKQHCAERLPRYMIPGDIRIVAQMSRTSTGKIDRVRTQKSVIDGTLILLTSQQVETTLARDS